MKHLVKIHVKFANFESGLIESKDFHFESSHTAADFVTKVEAMPGAKVVSDVDVGYYVTDELGRALEDLAKAKVRTVND